MQKTDCLSSDITAFVMYKFKNPRITAKYLSGGLKDKILSLAIILQIVLALTIFRLLLHATLAGGMALWF